MSSIPSEFARRLRLLREEAGWTQEQLAEKAGLSRNYIGLLELRRREPSLSTLLSLSAALSASLDELAGEKSRALAEDATPYKLARSDKTLLRVISAMRKCGAAENELIAEIVDQCARFARRAK